MDRRLLTPRLVVLHLFVIVLAVVFVRLGFWQLDRAEERRQVNAAASARLAMAPADAADLLDGEADPGALQYRRAVATGVFDPSHEVLVRSQVYRGNAGFHVVTPLLTDGGAIMVNRGWVPLDFDEVPVDRAAPPGGEVTVEGWLNISQTRPVLGREDPSGPLTVMSRVDLERIQSQLPYPIAPTYMVEIGERAEFPIPVDPPDFSDQGPHLAYAIQWFSFALIGVVGYLALLRRRAAPARSREEVA